MHMNRLGWMVPVLLAGCAAPESRPALAPVAMEALGLDAANAPAIDSAWWRGFGDPQLDRLVDAATAGNPSLDAAMARVRQAQAVLSARDAENGPNLTADGTALGQRLSGRYTIPPPYAGTVRFVGTAQANLDWNLDLFGRQRAAIEGATASVRAAGLDLSAARMMLAGSVVQTYLDLSRAEQEAAVAQRAIAARENSVRLTQVRIRNRLSSKLDAEAVGTLLSQAREELVRAQGASMLAANGLAALVGRGADFPATLTPTRLALDAALPLPSRVPADLLARRPDVLAARSRIDAAAAGRQVARRAFYPNVNLTALAGLQAIGIGNLFSLDAGTAGGGAAVHLPLFDNGRLRADLAGATAAEDLAIADYNGRVIGAVREAADGLARIRSVDAQRVQAAAVVRGFAETGRLNGLRVSSGLSSRLDLVDNDVRLLDAELGAANLLHDAAAARVQLVLALGGGFDPVQDSNP
ncbi:efflux transporter, outer membrane factor (OMF) lipoprotein, NodT family [Sphingomonas gellani]|uniref:Efflux transporter, outer membrane factor (OMF) lipoprotein, NodT family n=1 Tax=Sphingomonas gellani TaxID=1166340 RepID=A0A1H8F1L7_9SPHN|nr:efflux transporter outer membrane subunit [Sphingomonas gellani]SEN25619.1 efflux transporter, outer membrane factor (OMF) lipoprotein, NodT family [Sphingomonas gellani]